MISFAHRNYFLSLSLFYALFSFSFRISVMNFQDIRNEFVMQCKEQEQALIETQNREKFEEELTKQYQTRKISVRYANVWDVARGGNVAVRDPQL